MSNFLGKENEREEENERKKTTRGRIIIKKF